MRMLRFTVPVDDQPHEYDLPGEIKHVGSKTVNAVELWVLEDPTYGVSRHLFQVVGTGHEVPDGWTYVGTAVVGRDGALVWHLFEWTVL